MEELHLWRKSAEDSNRGNNDDDNNDDNEDEYDDNEKKIIGWAMKRAGIKSIFHLSSGAVQ